MQVIIYDCLTIYRCLYFLLFLSGHETKAMLNNGGPRYKRSSLERQMNQDVIWCVLTLVILCVIGAVGCKLWLNTYYHVGEPFVSDSFSNAAEAFLAFWTYVIILQVSEQSDYHYLFSFYYRHFLVMKV